MRPNIVAHKEEGDKRGEAAGDFFGVELFQQSAVGDVGGDDGGQLRAQTVVQQAVKGADEEAGVELGTQVVEDEQVGSGGGAQEVGGRPEAAAPVQAWNTEVPVERTLESDVTASDSRLLAVPANGRLSTEYFRTALFIGDSLSQGFALYAPTRDVATVCAYKSTSPNQVLQNFVGQRPDGSRIEMWDDIKVQSPSNIYVLYGTNALISQSDEAFLKYYSDLLDKLRERFAGVPIYVQSITPTTAEQGVKQPPLENGHIRLINNAIAKLAVSKGLYYVDLWEVMADENGYLRADLAGSDGLHLLDGSKYRPWLDYLAAHTIYSAHNAQFALADGGAYR